MNRWTSKLLLGLVLGLAVSWQGSGATTLPPMDLEDLADQAGLIFTGTAVHSEVVLSKDGKFPFTFVTFQVEETLKGAVRNGELTLRFHGGVVGDEAVVVAGMPELTVGQKYLLFVRGNGTSAFPVVGWRQGQFRFTQEPGSNRTLLVDSEERAVQGIEHVKWARDSQPVAESRRVDETEPPAVLLEVEGVTASPEPIGWRRTPGPAQAADAGQVVAELKVFLRSRSGRKSFAPGRLVESARVEEVPESFGIVPSPAPQQ
ncbi:MAG TPA: hypothetical protein VE685_25130 [Thermoanaerobaculia bacterium]|nr:hypothetical protein [Thermoanaerobaculia bacterium]